MKNFRIYISLLVSFFILSCTGDLGCTSSEIADSRDVNPEAVYFDYKIWAEEGRENVTINLKFRMGGANGTTLVLNEPSQVLFDGEILEVDSAVFTGAYYELQKPLASFSGKHEIIFIDLNGKEHKLDFEFRPFSLIPDLPAELRRRDLVINLEGLEPVDVVRIVAMDTSFSTADINDLDTVRNGQLLVTKEQLQSLANGPIHWEFYKEHEKNLANITREGGKLLVTYGLKRGTELKD